MSKPRSQLKLIVKFCLQFGGRDVHKMISYFKLNDGMAKGVFYSSLAA